MKGGKGKAFHVTHAIEKKPPPAHNTEEGNGPCPLKGKEDVCVSGGRGRRKTISIPKKKRFLVVPGKGRVFDTEKWSPNRGGGSFFFFLGKNKKGGKNLPSKKRKKRERPPGRL